MALVFLSSERQALAADVRQMDIAGIKLGDRLEEAKQHIKASYPDMERRVFYKTLVLDDKQRQIVASDMLVQQHKGKDGSRFQIALHPDQQTKDRVIGLVQINDWAEQKNAPTVTAVLDSLIDKYSQPTYIYQKFDQKKKRYNFSMLWLEDIEKIAEPGNQKLMSAYGDYMIKMVSGDIYEEKNAHCHQPGTKGLFGRKKGRVAGSNAFFYCYVHSFSEPDAKGRQQVAAFTCGLMDVEAIYQSYKYFHPTKPSDTTALTTK